MKNTGILHIDVCVLHRLISGFRNERIMLYIALLFILRAARAQILLHHMMITHFYLFKFISFDFVSDADAVFAGIAAAAAAAAAFAPNIIYLHTSERTLF